MRNNHSRLAIIFAAIIAVAGSASAQPIGPGPIGPAPIGPGPGLISPGPMRLPSIAGLIGPLTIDMSEIRLALNDQDRQDREKEAEQRERDRETRLIEQGRDDIDNGRYDRAIGRFSDAAAMKGAQADTALYNKAWAQNKIGQRAEALATLAALTKDYPKTRYLTQAKALETEVRSSSGQPVRPENQQDEDLKLYAIAALQNSDPQQAVPMLEKLLEGTASPRVKSKALFVLAQSDSPRAREVLKKVASGNSSPDLQSRAIDYLGTQGGSESRALLADFSHKTLRHGAAHCLQRFMAGRATSTSNAGFSAPSWSLANVIGC